MRFLLLSLFASISLLGDVKHVYITWEDDPCTSLTINIHATTPTLKLAYDQETQLTFDDYEEHYELDGTGFIDRYIYHHTIKGLEPDNLYFFSIQGDREYKVRTAPDTPPYRFIFGGDCEVTEKAENILMEIAKWDPTAIIFGGDYGREITTVNDIDKWDEWFDLYLEHLLTPDDCLIPLILAIGNHDVFGQFSQTPDRAPFYYNFFKQTPNNKSYFTKTFGKSVAITILDSGHTAAYKGPQKKFLEETLRKHQNIPIHFTSYHIPIYPSVRFTKNNAFFQLAHNILSLQGQGYRSNAILLPQSELGREHWVPLFDQYGLTAAFEHHDQTLKRTKPLKNSIPTKDGTLYLGDGGIGPEDQYTPIQTYLQPYFAKTLSHVPFFWVVDCTEKRVNYRAINHLGNVLDETTQKVKKCLQNSQSESSDFLTLENPLFLTPLQKKLPPMPLISPSAQSNQMLALSMLMTPVFAPFQLYQIVPNLFTLRSHS